MVEIDGELVVIDGVVDVSRLLNGFDEVYMKPQR
jgi:hypothetical protein